jgi:elongation factor Ts
MSKFSLAAIKRLRELTGAGILDCRQALEEAGGDEKEAAAILKTKGFAKAQKKEGRETAAGAIGCYLHTDGKVASLVELFCETDFVAKTEEFKTFAHELAMQVASMNPKNGKVLLDQEYIREPTKKISDLLIEKKALLGENIKIGRLVRIKVGED